MMTIFKFEEYCEYSDRHESVLYLKRNDAVQAMVDKIIEVESYDNNLRHEIHTNNNVAWAELYYETDDADDRDIMKKLYVTEVAVH